MSSHTFPKINQKEYLKKYLSGDKTKKKKKDRKHKKSSKDSVKVKIIDDDLNQLDVGPEIDEELLLTGDDAPQIVGEYIEEAPADKKVPKWKSIVIKDEPDDNENRSDGRNEDDLWGRKTNELRIKEEYSTSEKRSNRTPDNSPPRRKNRRHISPSSSLRRPRESPSLSKTSKGDKSSTKSRQAHYSPDRRTKIKTEPLSPCQEKSRGNKFSDQSPPRRRQNSTPQDSSPSRNGKNAETRRNQHIESPDNSPPRRRRNSSQSPVRTKRYVNRSPDTSSQHNSRHFRKSPAPKRYNSPPRRTRSSDQSPPKKYKSSFIQSEYQYTARHRSSISRDRNADHSPARRKQSIDQRRDSDQSPPRRKKRHSSEVSPRQKCKQRTKTPDNSPPRKSKKVFDSSPMRRRLNSDQSPPRRKRKPSIEAHVKQEKRTPDLSPRPPRQSRWEKDESEKSQSPPPTHKPKPGKTLDGKKAGLQNAQALQKETKERRKNEDILFETMSSEISGRNAEVQVRSTGRKGRRAREAANEDPEERRRKEEYEEKKKQQYDRWGKGLKQIEDHKNRMLQQEYESSKPLARYANDEDLERHLKEQERAEDPMLEYMRQKRKEKEKQSGKPEIPRYKGSYPENRFGIPPGYRWDGVDRSNGYEKKYFAVQTEKLARRDEAYKYSVEDM